MPARVQRRTQRLETRLTTTEKDRIARAARLKGRTITDFVIESATEAANRTLQEHEVWILSEKDRQLFVQALLNPPKPTRKALAAAKRYREEIG